MITHVWSVLCETSILDQDTQLISMINSVEELTVPEPPKPDVVYPIVMNLVSLWMRSDIKKPGSGFARYQFVSPSGEVVQSLEQDLDLTKYERLRSRSQFAGFRLPGVGQYYFNVEYRNENNQKWKKVAALPVKVNIKKE